MNLAHIIDPHPAEHVALFSRGRPTTYGALRDQVAHLRGGLSGLGVAAGDRVVLLCSNGRYFVDLYLAILGVGAVAVPLNPTSPASAIEREVAAVGASVVGVEPSSAAAWAQVRRDAVPSVRHVVSTELVDAVVGVERTFEDLLAAAPLPMVEVAADALAVLMFTSGTAGSPKAAMLSHGNLLANLQQSTQALDTVKPSDVVYGILPLFHIFGFTVGMMKGAWVGATLLLFPRFDVEAVLDAVRAGDNPGEHTIVFGMMGETIELTVKASNRDCYAIGALTAAKFVAGKSPGIYGMADVLNL